MENNIKTHCEINGIILTPEAIEELKNWQKNDNEDIKVYRETIADVVCFLARNFSQFNCDDEVALLMEELGFLREKFKLLMKP